MAEELPVNRCQERLLYFVTRHSAGLGRQIDHRGALATARLGSCYQRLQPVLPGVGRCPPVRQEAFAA